MPAKVVNGARAVVHIADASSNTVTPIGIWNNFSYSVTYDVQPVFLLGRYSAAELNTTAVEPVAITAQGWRTINHGPYLDGKLPNIKDLLTQEDLLLTVFDRQTGQFIAKISDCKPTGVSTTLSAKQLQETTTTYVGLLLDDGDLGHDPINEAASAVNLPPQT